MEPPIFAYIGAGVTVAGLVVAVLRYIHQRERTHEDHAKLREEFDVHMKEADGLIQRFIILEQEARVFEARLEEIRKEVIMSRSESREDRGVVLNAIGDLRSEIEAKLDRLRTAVYEGERRQSKR